MLEDGKRKGKRNGEYDDLVKCGGRRTHFKASKSPSRILFSILINQYTFCLMIVTLTIVRIIDILK